jgi:large subunit ribosomal protein L35Ae
MKGKILSFRRGKKTYKPRQFIIEVEGIKTIKDAKSLAKKSVQWKSPAGKEINGYVSVPHGSKGNVRVVFEKGLPGQAINESVEIK